MSDTEYSNYGSFETESSMNVFEFSCVSCLDVTRDIWDLQECLHPYIFINKLQISPPATCGFINLIICYVRFLDILYFLQNIIAQRLYGNPKSIPAVHPSIPSMPRSDACVVRGPKLCLYYLSLHCSSLATLRSHWRRLRLVCGAWADQTGHKLEQPPTTIYAQ